MMLIESDLDLSVLLKSIVSAACELVGARYGALGVIGPDGKELSNFVTIGINEEVRRRIGDAPLGHGLLGVVILSAAAHRSNDLHRDPGFKGFPPGHPDMTTFLGVPVVTADGRVFGNLYLTDRLDHEPFSDQDEILVTEFGRAAGLIVDEARLRAQLRELTLTEERERLARDLHDTVIQRLFAVGLSLQATLMAQMSDDARSRINAAVDDLDATIRSIRTTIFEITRERSASTATLRTRILTVIDEVTTRLGVPVDVSFEGPLDALVGQACADHVMRALRELLSNVVRHSGASSVHVRVEVGASGLSLTIADNGKGFDVAATTGRGLRNLAERAQELNGTFSVEPASGGGTIVTWSAQRLD